MKRTDDENAQRKSREAERMANLQLRTDIREVLGTPSGRRFVRHIFARCGQTLPELSTGRVSYSSDGQVDTHQTFLHIGASIVAKELSSELSRLAPSSWIEMIREATSDRLEAESKEDEPQKQEA